MEELEPTFNGELDGPSESFGIGSNSKVPVEDRRAPPAIVISPSVTADQADAFEEVANVNVGPFRGARWKGWGWRTWTAWLASSNCGIG